MRDPALRWGFSALACAAMALGVAGPAGGVPALARRFHRLARGAWVVGAPSTTRTGTVPRRRTAQSAAPLARRVIGGTSACPRPAAVWDELATLLPAGRLNRDWPAARDAAPLVVIADLGARYRLVAATGMREYRDDTRDCAHRARVAAVFVALTMGVQDAGEGPSGLAPAPLERPPPAVAQPTPRVPIRPVPAAPLVAAPAAADTNVPHAVEAAPKTGSPGTPPRSSPAVLALAAGGGAVLGAGSGEVVVTPDLTVRLTAERGSWRGRWAVTGGIGVSAPARATVGGVRIRQARLPVDLGVRRNLVGSSSWSPYGQLGLDVAIVWAQAVDLNTNEANTALEFGVRAVAGLRLFRRGPLVTFIELDAEAVPAPASVQALPRGIVGHTSNVWIGASIGASMELIP